MNQERQKTDAIADAVEIPKGATHCIKTKMGPIYANKNHHLWFDDNCVYSTELFNIAFVGTYSDLQPL